LALGRQPAENEFSAAQQLATERRLETVCWALLNASEFLYLP